MKIDTKYNIGDTVWFMHENRAQEGVAGYIHVDIRIDGMCTERYTISWIPNGPPIVCQWLVECLFPTKEALLESL